MSAEPTTAQNTPVLMPKLGQAMTEGTVQQWHRKDGERVEKGSPLLAIETDKATYDIEAPAGGTLYIHVGEGREVRVGTVLGEIGDAPRGTQVAIATPPAHPSPTVTSVPTSARKRVLASPRAKQLAAAHGIELATITASGSDGVISAADVEKAARATPAIGTSSPAAPAAPLSRTVRERRPLTGIRKTSARRVQEAWQTTPHIVQMVDVDATALLATRAQLKVEVPALTLNDLILHAAARVMAGLPDLNATVEGDVLVLYDGVGIGFAADTPRGLVVPVIRGADKLSVQELAAESQRLIEAARVGRLGPDDVGNASLTVSNLGMFGIRFGTPVINLGEPVLVFVGAVEERPVAVSGQVVIRPVLTLSIGYDHRVADGVAASQFTRGLKEQLESGVRSPASEVRNTGPQSPAPSTQEELGKREIRSDSEGMAYAVRLRSPGHEWVLDEPVTDGGRDAGPDPVTALLGALLSCMTISFKAAARRRKVSVERIEGHVRATPRGHVKEILMSLNVWSADAEENVRALLDPAKRGCYVSGLLRPEVDFTVRLEVLSSGLR